ncbi:regulatory protein GemA [Nitrospinae bacterium AH_259_B05_G02_I21]|nr:regulatory protein GemA [Nitrospinae bacterium AH_259_B05_G02_I21]
MTTPITPAQRRKIFRQLAILEVAGDDDRRALQKEIVGKPSLKTFTSDDARRLIDELNKRGAEEKPKRKPVRPPKLPDNVIHFITPKQRTKIEIMAQQVVWREEDGLELWMLKWFVFRYPRTNHEVDKVIHGLKSLKAQQEKRRLEEGVACG